MAFTRRILDFQVTLASSTGTNQPGTFVESGANNIIFPSGLRASVDIINSGLPVGCEAHVRVWGLRQSLMNQLSTLGKVFNLVPKNVLTINAGDEDGLSLVFSGVIIYAYADYSAQPDVPFVFMCQLLGTEAVAPALPSSYTGTTDVATVVAGLARLIGLGFENNGVTAKLPRPYLSGSVLKQIDDACDQTGTLWAVDSGKNAVVIWPLGKNREGGDIPTISRDTGMIGYPSFTQQGIIVKTIFDPKISVGQLIKVESSVLSGIGAAAPQVNFPTQWAVNKVDLRLESEMPNGNWMMTLYAYNPGYARAIIPPAR